MKKNKLLLLAGIVLSFFVSSCEEEDIKGFEADAAVNFSQKTQTFSFLGTDGDSKIIEIPVQIIGNATDYDRTFNVEVIADSSNAEPGSYEILGGTVKAGEFEGNLLVEVYNSPELADTEASIFMALDDSDDFKAGNKESLYYELTWTDKVVVPSWSYYRYFFTSVASTQAYRAIVESTGLLTFSLADYRNYGPIGAEALGVKFGDYVKQYNLDNPDNPMLHDDGAQAGQPIVPLYYTKSKYD